MKGSYNREKRRIIGVKSGSASNRKSAYIYFNMLSFLNCNTPPTNTQSNFSAEEPEDTEMQLRSENQTKKGPYETRILGRKRKPQDEVGQELVNVLKQSAEDRRKSEHEMFRDEDKLFMLSLVSDFKKVPDHLKLSVKRQFINILEQNQGQFPSATTSQGYTGQGIAPYPSYSGYNAQYSQGYSTTNAQMQYPTRQHTATPQSTGGSDCSGNDSADSPILMSCFDNTEEL